MAELKACKVCAGDRQKCFGLAVDSLDQLKAKGAEALGFSRGASLSVVLEDDGTVLEDDDYFLCLPANTKFMLLRHDERWMNAHQTSRESAVVEVDGTDHVGVFGSWYGLALQLRQDLASLILMSEADLQTLVDVPCSDLAAALGFTRNRTRVLQDTLQRTLDRREEERQAKDLLKLYLRNAAEPQPDSVGADETDGVRVEAMTGLSATTLQLLKDKPHPETRLSNHELQAVLRQGSEVMMQALDWDSEMTSALLQTCHSELRKRLQRVQALQSLSAHKTGRAKRRKTHT